jgi:serine/threonine protein kinase
MPSTFKDFTVLEKLGQGSFGAVYRVLRAADQQVYVLKRIALDAMGPAERALAVQECWLMASLSSPYVVRYYDSFNDEGALGIVMELCSGGDLQRALKARAGGPPLAEAELQRQAAELSVQLPQGREGGAQAQRTDLLMRQHEAQGDPKSEAP